MNTRTLPASTSGSPVLPAGHTPRPKQRLQFVTALRAVASIIILWHHFALYPPLREWAAPILGSVLDWLEANGRATQVFFVVGGYVMARTMSHRRWTLREVGSFVTQRYARLGIPYLGAIALVIPAYLVARDWLPEAIVGAPVTLPQLVAHLFFLQNILGYENLSAGLWFVCINFQLSLVYVAILFLRDSVARGRIDLVGWFGWPLAAISLFYFNLNSALDNWWLYFYPHFFVGTVIHRCLHEGRSSKEFWGYQLLLVAAMVFDWRWRVLSALIVGLLLYSAERMGWGHNWPRNRAIAWLGNVSYSLFLVHFPVLVLVSTAWLRLGWTSPVGASSGLFVAFGVSIGAAALFHRWVEQPASQLGHTSDRRPRMNPAT